MNQPEYVKLHSGRNKPMNLIINNHNTAETATWGNCESNRARVMR